MWTGKSFKNGTIHLPSPKNFAAIFDAQHNISEILNKYFEESNCANRQRQSYYYAMERWRDIKIALMNKLAKVKSHLGAQLSEELCKPMTDHRSYIEVRDSIELLVSMIEMTYSLQYKYEDHTTAILFIDAQLEKINAHARTNDLNPGSVTSSIRS
jgi:hypothetical protein